MSASHTLGMVEVATSGSVAAVGTSLVIEFPDGVDPHLEINGRSFHAATVPDLAAAVGRHLDSRRRLLLAIPCEVDGDDYRLVLTQPSALVDRLDGCHLVGEEAVAAVDRAAAVAGGGPAWQSAVEFGGAERRLLDSLTENGTWGGPLIVSMPRTGSTLFGTLMLKLCDPPGSDRPVFDRYVHEPAAPVFWDGEPVSVVKDIIAPPLTERDVIQESAYQFASKELAMWFLRRARPPIVFVVRHPQRTWPSRWRIMLSMLLEDRPPPELEPRAQAALARSDFSELGDFLTGVRPPDNGWYSFLSLVDACREEGLEFMVVENALFRRDPPGVIAELCAAWDVPYDDAAVKWRNLEDVIPRVVMGELARGREYEWYYARTMGSSEGIVTTDIDLLPADRFPSVLRGSGGEYLSIDEAVTWHHLLLTRQEALTSTAY